MYEGGCDKRKAKSGRSGKFSKKSFAPSTAIACQVNARLRPSPPTHSSKAEPMLVGNDDSEGWSTWVEPFEGTPEYRYRRAVWEAGFLRKSRSAQCGHPPKNKWRADFESEHR